MKQVLLFNLESNNELKSILNKLNIKSIDVSKNSQNQKIGYLLNKKGYSISNNIKPSFNNTMIVFDGFNDNELNITLKLLKESNIKIELKSIVTKYNINWDSIELKDELMKEYLEMRRMQNKSTF